MTTLFKLKTLKVVIEQSLGLNPGGIPEGLWAAAKAECYAHGYSCSSEQLAALREWFGNEPDLRWHYLSHIRKNISSKDIVLPPAKWAAFRELCGVRKGSQVVGAKVFYLMDTMIDAWEAQDYSWEAFRELAPQQFQPPARSEAVDLIPGRDILRWAMYSPKGPSISSELTVSKLFDRAHMRWSRKAAYSRADIQLVFGKYFS